MPRARRTLVCGLALVALVPAVAGAHGTTRTLVPPWEAGHSWGSCRAEQAPVAPILGGCEARASANARTGATRSLISTLPVGGAHTEAWFHTTVPDTMEAYRVRALAYLTVDALERASPDDEVLGQVWIGHSACECYAASDLVRLDTADDSGLGEMVGVDAALEEPAQDSWAGSYLVAVRVVVSTQAISVASRHRVRSLVTFRSLEILERH